MATILIAEDHPQSRESLVTLLGCNGHRPLGAADGAEALSLVHSERPDLVIADILMPITDGYEFARQLRADPDIAQTPIVFYTASYLQPEAQALARACGVRHLISNPAEPEDILRIVEVALCDNPPSGPLPSKAFHSKYHRVLTAKLAQKVTELEQEVEERKHAEEALLQSEERFRALIENATDIITVVDARATVLYESPSALRILGYTPEERIGGSAFRFVHPNDVDTIVSWFVACSRQPGIAPPVLYRFQHRDGFWRNIEANGNNLLQHPGVRGIVVNARDVTERRQLEEQLLQSQKMEGIGRLAGGIAHDFNNLLMAILGYAELVQEHLTDDHLAYGHLKIIQQAAERAAGLTRQLLSFARKQAIEIEIINLNDLVLAVDMILRPLLGAAIELVTAPFEEPIIVKADPIQLEQVLVNMAVNARDAMPVGGKLTIQISRAVVNAFSESHAAMVPGEYALLTVHDTGTGMTAETKAHLFEPFFTTKGPGKGTGLGLATCYGIVQQSGGSIEVESEPGSGSTFTIHLPCEHGAKAVVACQAVAAGNHPRGTETILVVEDEPLVRGIVTKILRAQGYNLLEASNGCEALNVVEKYNKRIDLLVTDVVMPQMGGRELAERLSAILPGLRVLITSGYSNGEEARLNALDPDFAFLQKPFTKDTLTNLVRHMLDASDAKIPVVHDSEDIEWQRC